MEFMMSTYSPQRGYSEWQHKLHVHIIPVLGVADHYIPFTIYYNHHMIKVRIVCPVNIKNIIDRNIDIFW